MGSRAVDNTNISNIMNECRILYTKAFPHTKVNITALKISILVWMLIATVDVLQISYCSL